VKLLIAVLASIGAIFLAYGLAFRKPQLGMQCPKHGYFKDVSVCPICGFYD
jgi:hypothetical protein